MTEKLRWLTITVPDEAATDLAALGAALGDALTRADLVASDVVHLKLWAHPSVTRDAVAAAWTQLFADREHRPSVSVIASPQPDGVGAVLTVAAQPGGQVRSFYEPSQTEPSFPAASAAGDHLFVAALTSQLAGTEAAAQADEVFARLADLLRAAGASPSGLGHMFVWYRDHSVRDVINEPFLQLFPTPGDRPARHSVVRELPAGSALMIEAAGSVSAARACYTIGGLWHGGIGGAPNSLPFGALSGDLLFSAGTYGRDPGTGEIPDGFAEQAGWAVHYSREFLRVAGRSAADVGQIYVWIRNAADADDARKVVEAAFAADGSPISIQVIQAGLPGSNQIQIELVAQAAGDAARAHDALS